MRPILEVILALLAVAGLMSLSWLLMGRILTPVGSEETVSLVPGTGDGETLEQMGCRWKVIHTPGHTWGGCCYYVASENVLFSGDTLFQESVGRTDFETSSVSDLMYSVREKLFKLPDETHVYPGHMGETLIGHEKTHNPYV